MPQSDEKKLNKEQQEAVYHGEGPLLIIAGAGTGKTTVITERIKYLVTSGLAKPSEILALTFTEKAAREMEERVDVVLPLGYTQMWISTFHSFCDRVLRNEAIYIGLDPRYKLLTEAEAVMFIRKNLFKFDLNYFRPLGNPTKFISGMLQHFSRLKDEDISPKEYLEWVILQKEKLKKEKTDPNEEVKKIGIEEYQELASAYKTYEELKIAEGVMDFGDLITNTLKLFREKKKILKEYQDRFKYILVDEFQDTNYAQNELALLLAGDKKNITVCADDDQAIYRWRGAAVSNVIQFTQRVPQTKIVVLTKNYRSTQEILDKAYQLIQNNNPDRLEVKEKIDKKLISVREVKDIQKVKFIHADRVENEADTVAREIKKLLGKGYTYKDFAILVRANNHADSFVKALSRYGIPFQFLGPGMLFKQPEVKDLISYLKVLYNFEDSVAMYRLLSMDFFEINGRDLASITNYSKKNNISLFEACENIEKISVSEKTKKTVEKIIKIIHRHLELIKKETAGQILYYFLEDSGLLKRLAEYKTATEEKKVNNIAEFFDKLKSYEVEHEDATVSAVVDWINLSMELGESPLASDIDWTENDAVNILTVHSAKGLEFPVVFLVNLVSQRFPTTERKEQIPIPKELIKEILPEGDYHIQEERRLFYVGMTRAKDILYLTAADYYGEGKREKRISQFVYEALGKEIVDNSPFKINNQLSIFDFRPPDLREIKTANKSTILYLSFSQIESFDICPLQYKYKYILHIPVPPSASQTFGDVIHQTMRDFYQRAIAGQNPTKEDLLKFLEENWSPIGYSSKSQEERMKKEGKKILEEYFLKAYDPKNLPVCLEQDFDLKISPDLIIKGKIDRIDKIKGGFEIIDYKTGSAFQKKDPQTDFQLTIYAMVATSGILEYMGVLEETPDPNQLKVSFYFFENQEKVTGTRTKEQLEKAKRDLIIKAKEINESEFLPTPGKMCDFCEYKLLCEAWR